MSFNLLALGDVHLDSPTLLDEGARVKLENLKKEAFKKAVEEAINRNVSAFIICGDLFDEESVSFETLIFLRKCFLRLEACNTKIIYSHGRYDPNPAPELIQTGNLIDFPYEAERYVITAQDGTPEAVVYASGFSNNSGLLAEQLEEKNEDIPVIGAMYMGDGFSNEGAMVLDSMANLNYDLIALGGYHHYLVARSESNVIYTGSPTGIWFQDKSGGALYAELNNMGELALDRILLSEVSWHTVKIDNITDTDLGSLKRNIEIEIQNEVKSAHNAFVKTELSGRCYIDGAIDEKTLGAELSKTLDMTVFIEAKNLLPVLPKTLFDSTSPFVESVKIIDSIKNDDEKLEQLIDIVAKKHGLFYTNIKDDNEKSYKNDLKAGLLDTICKVMVREASDEN